MVLVENKLKKKKKKIKKIGRFQKKFVKLD